MTTPIASPAGTEPIICLPWCETGDGHPDQTSRAAQSCSGVPHRVSLSSEAPQQLADGREWRHYATTYLSQQADQPHPRVFIGKDECDGALATLEEARRFALEILTLVDRQRDRA